MFSPKISHPQKIVFISTQYEKSHRNHTKNNECYDQNIRSNNATMNQINKQANAMNKETDANQKMKTSAE